MRTEDTENSTAPSGGRWALRSGAAYRWLVGLSVGLLAVIGVELLVVVLRVLPARAAATAGGGALSDQVMMWGFVAAALSTGLAALGAAYAVSHVGSAALGAMGERPEVAGRALIFVGLAEGIAIYGLIISIMILSRLG